MYSYYFPCDQASSFLARFFQDPYFKIRKKNELWKKNSSLFLAEWLPLPTNGHKHILLKKKASMPSGHNLTGNNYMSSSSIMEETEKAGASFLPQHRPYLLASFFNIFTDSWPSCDRLAMFLSQNYLYIQWPRLQDLSVFHTCPPPVAPIFLCVFEWPWEAGWPFIFHLFITPWNPQSILCSWEKKNALCYQKLKSK